MNGNRNCNTKCILAKILILGSLLAGLINLVVLYQYLGSPADWGKALSAIPGGYTISVFAIAGLAMLFVLGIFFWISSRIERGIPIFSVMTDRYDEE